MMKKTVMIAAMLILVQIAAAQQENYNQYSTVVINVKIYTTIDVVKTGLGSIDYLQADLELFPRNTTEQEITKEEIVTQPEAEMIKRQEGNIIMEWRDIKTSTINYSLNSNAKTYNWVKQIGSKVNFPIQQPNPELRTYLKGTDYIDINEEIMEKAAEVAEGETDLYIIAYNVGEWVRENIRYDLNSLTATVVQKSSWVMTNREGVCDEITNLYISMMRSLGVPARFVSGIVYSNSVSTFENHGWAEIYIPEYGWVPFDITFGQYGWVDPSHVKMDESEDSGEASVTYNWKARNADLKIWPMKVETQLIKKEGRAARLSKVEVKPIESDVGFGSYMVLEVSVENLQDYYLPLLVSLTKSPEIMEKNPATSIVLKPREKKRFYWILKIPQNLDENYIYTSQIEVQSNFADDATSQIRYGQGFKKYSLEWATQTFEMLAEREEKVLFTNVDLNCLADKQQYLSTQNAEIECRVKNSGSQNLDKIKVCIREKCKETSLRIAEEKIVKFELDIKKSESITITAETEDYINEETIMLNVIETPEVKIIGYSPETIDYKEKTNLKLRLFTETKAKDIAVVIEGVGEVTLQELEGIHPVNVPVTGKELRRGMANIKITYKNEKGETFLRQEKIGVMVNGSPWYAKILNWLGL